MLTLHEKRLLVAHPDVAVDAGRMVAEGRVRVVGRASSIEVHATVELEPDVFRRSVGAGHDAEVAVFDHGDSGAVGVFFRSNALGVAAVRIGSFTGRIE